MNLLRTIVFMSYLFGYIFCHLPVLRRAEKALAAGDQATVDAIVNQHVPHWCHTLLRIAGTSVTVEGRENIPAGRACVFVANHRSYFDIPLMLTSLDRPHGLMAKHIVEKLPGVNRWMALLGCVYVKREDVRASMQALNTATEYVAAGHSFSIFPEGTRHKGGEGTLGDWKGGAFRIAAKCGAPVVPVAISHSRDCFENHHNLCTPTQVTVRILPAIETAGMSRAEQKALPEQARAAIQAALQP